MPFSIPCAALKQSQTHPQQKSEMQQLQSSDARFNTAVNQAVIFGFQLVLGRQTQQRLSPPIRAGDRNPQWAKRTLPPVVCPLWHLRRSILLTHSSHGGDDGNINSRDTLAFNSFLVVPNRNSTIWTELHRTHQPLDCCGFLVDSVLCLVTFVTLCHRARLFLSLAHLFFVLVD